MSALLFREETDWEKPVAAHLTPAVFVHESLRLDVALRQMQRVGQRLAVVLAADQTETGVVALEDILTVMFGEVKM